VLSDYCTKNFDISRTLCNKNKCHNSSPRFANFKFQLQEQVWGEELKVENVNKLVGLEETLPLRFKS